MKFKVTKKLLSILLLICLSLQVLPTVADATNINSNPSSIDSEARELTYEDILAGNATVDEVFGKLDANTVPDALDYDVAVSRQHIERLYDEESNDLNRVVFLNADGSKTAYIYDYPVKYINSDGKIKDISLEIKNSSTVGSFETKDNSIVSTFSKNAYEGIRLEGNGESLVLVPNMPPKDTISSTKAVASTEASMAKKINNKKVSYKYDEKTTIEYSLTYTGFKEDIVVSEYTGQTEYDFTLYTNGLKLVNDNGSFCLKDENNVVKAILGEIIIFTADEKNNTWGELKAETIKENEEYKLTIVVDPAFLSDPKTTYPIRIDPTLEICYNNNGAGAISDVTINSNSGSNGATNTVFIGLRQTYGISRLLMKFPGLDLDEIVGTADITNATVEIRDVMCEADELTIYCYPFTGNVWDESTVTWANVNPGSFSTRLSSNAISYTNGRAQEELYRYKFDITAAVVGWKAGTYNQNKGIIFKSSNAFENGTTYMHKTFASYNYTAYRPSLSITYSEYGNVVSDGTYYINNTYCGEYLRYTSSGATPKAGLIASLGDTIRWEIVGVTGGYVIRSKADPTKYLGVPTDTSSINVSLVTLSNTAIPDRCIWNIRGYGGYTVIKNKYSSKYLYSYGNTINTANIVEDASKPQVILTRAWRIVSQSNMKELSSFCVNDTILNYGETKVLSVNSKAPSSASLAAHSDFKYSVVSTSPSEWVSITRASSETTSKAVVNGLGSAVIKATHIVTGKTTLFNVSAAMLIYQTRQRETEGFVDPTDDADVNSITPEDYMFGDYSTLQLKTSGIFINDTDLTTGNFANLTLTQRYAKRITIFRNFCHSQLNNDEEKCGVIDDMIDHFLDGQGSVFQNEVLTQHVTSHSNTRFYTESVIELLKEYIEENSGDLLGLWYDEDLWTQPTLRSNHPMVRSLREHEVYEPSYGFNNGDSLLSLAIDSWYGNKFEISSYSTDGDSYSGVVRFTFYDHFGLDSEDLRKKHDFNMHAGYFEGFRQWFILQHWDELETNNKPKPFVTKVVIDVSFCGSL